MAPAPRLPVIPADASGRVVRLCGDIRIGRIRTKGGRAAVISAAARAR